MSVTLSFSSLAVLGYQGYEGYQEKLPLTALNLNWENSHIHGELSFQIDNRTVPHMGYWGRDDVCFCTWLVEFERIIKLFDSAAKTRYRFDEGEQGQPAYFFKKRDDKIFFSIVASNYSSGGPANPEWQQIEFSYQEFKFRYLEFKELFLDEIKKAAPDMAEEWMKKIVLDPVYKIY